MSVSDPNFSYCQQKILGTIIGAFRFIGASSKTGGPQMNRGARSIQVLLALAIVALSAAFAQAKKPDHDGYVQTNLVSDGAVPATFTDPNLKNPWGITFRAASGMTSASPFWISDNNGGVSTLYDGTGTSISALPLVTIPLPNGSPGGSPTGTVFNTFQPG